MGENKMMTYQERLAEIEEACRVDEHELAHRKANARLEYQAKCLVHTVKADMNHFFWAMQDLINQGYQLDKRHPPVINGFGVIGFFVKPDRLIRRELQQFEKDVEQSYMQELTDRRERMEKTLQHDLEASEALLQRHQLEMESLAELERFVKDSESK